jgi:hypothetical protein
LLLGYKESPVDEERQHLGAMVCALVHEALDFAASGAVAAAGGGVDLVVPVPSTSRPGVPPLARVPGLERVIADALPEVRWEPTLLCRSGAENAPEAPPLAHLRPHASGFVVDPNRVKVVARRVLLLEDTYVSGARAQSAAAALRVAGVHAVVIVPLGRVLRPDQVPLHASFLRRHRRRAAAATTASSVRRRR